MFCPPPPFNEPAPDLPTSAANPFFATLQHTQLASAFSIRHQLQAGPRIIDRPLYILPPINRLNSQIRHYIIKPKLDVFVVARPVDLLGLEADLIGQGDEGVVVDCKCNGGAKIRAGEVSELNGRSGGGRGWRGGETEAVNEPFVV